MHRAMDRQERMTTDDERHDEDWIFAAPDPGTLPTEQLPGREEFERYSAPLVAGSGRRPSRPEQHNAETVDLSSLPDDVADLAEQRAADSAGRARAGGPLAPGGARIGESDEPAPITAPLRVPTYARSGTTPNAAADDDARTPMLPRRFHDLGIFDALRDLLALVCLVIALSTTFTLGELRIVEIAGKTGIGIALIGLVVVHLLRWVPSTPPLRLIRVLRVIAMLPALAVGIGVIVADAVTSLPVLFSALPDGPPVGVGVGVAMLLLGAIVGIEPRAHEGYLPAATARARSRMVLLAIGVAALVLFAVATVMAVGRVFTTGWAFSLMSFADTLISALLLAILLGSAMRRERSWFVFSVAAVGALVIAALADNTLRLSFAAPESVATGFVYLPLLLSAYGVMISRSFVRTMPVSFERSDWLVYAVRAFEFSILMHSAAVVWNLAAAIAAGRGVTPGGTVVHLMDALVCAMFVAVSLLARKALLERPAQIARASGVVSALVLVIVGFLAVIVNSLATGAGVGLVTGGTALALGIAAALMLTVPAPVRDEFGAPDLARMFAEFRHRNARRDPLLSLIPDIAAERSRRKTFPRT